LPLKDAQLNKHMVFEIRQKKEVLDYLKNSAAGRKKCMDYLLL
jgi:hypothetical protein